MLLEHEGRFSIEDGKRIYAVGDVHGRDDLFVSLISLISADNERRGAADTWLVILGDLIDRGPSSRKVLCRCFSYSQQSDKFVVVKGNHEAMMALVLSGGFRSGVKGWLEMGGDATLRSWGVREDIIAAGSPSKLLKAARRVVPVEVLNWMSNLVPIFRSGDVVFVHAGIKPGVPLWRQDEQDLLWIQDEFLSSTDCHSALVIHGHTICEEGPETFANRIGIDTGAYRTNRLTAIGLEGRKHWFLQSIVEPC